MDDPISLKFALKVTHPFRTPQFRRISAHSASTVRADEKLQLALIGSRPRAFQRAIDEPCTLLLSPARGGTKRDFAIFSANFNFCRKTSAAKFLCVKTSSGKVVATLFPYPTANRSIAGDVPIYLKLAFKVTHPFRKRRFPKISFSCASRMKATTDTFCNRILAQSI